MFKYSMTASANGGVVKSGRVPWSHPSPSTTFYLKQKHPATTTPLLPTHPRSVLCRLHWGENTVAPFPVGDTTLSAEAMRMVVGAMRGKALVRARLGARICGPG